MNILNDIQFYITPPTLAKRAWDMFKNRNFQRVLEPSAGTGELALAGKRNSLYGNELFPDVCEIDVEKHAILRSKGLNVVGMDFMKFTSGAIYSHAILNPPFKYGVQHTLKAYDCLWDGEVVSIINAESVRNPCTAERQLLKTLIEHCGSVEFVEGAFAVPEAERKTNVEVAIVYLRKKANVDKEIFAPVIASISVDEMSASGLAGNYRDAQEIALSNSSIENMVTAFNAAVKTMREAVMAEARSQYYARLIGETMAARNGDGVTEKADTSVNFVRKTIFTRYIEIKDRAWSAVLRSSNVMSKLSSNAQRTVEKEFDSIKKLEFTVDAIYGFLCGIVDSQTEIQMQMCCDVFDLISRFHEDNLVYFKGYKSNSKHRTCGMRIKTTRFILPHHSAESYQTQLGWDSMRMLEDFDKVSALLDGKIKPDVGLVDVFSTQLAALRQGERINSSYFSVRWYPGAATIHFFPRDKKMIDRLNLWVGRRRAWLPPTEAGVSSDFWLQFNQAEKFDKEVRAEIKKAGRSQGWWKNPLYMLHSNEQSSRDEANAAIDSVLDTVLERHGIDVNSLLEDMRPEQLRLKAA